MRSHAKASTAGSTQRQAKGLGHIFRGAFATRGASLDVKGSSAPGARRLALPIAVFAAIVATMALVVSPAGAAKTHLFKEAFGPAAQPSFTGVRGVAIDQSSGDVLVMEAGPPASIKRYNADGSADSFPATGTNVIDGTGTGDETPQSGLEFAAASESQIAVDNSGGATDGNIYVTQSSPNLVNVFSEDGAYLGQLTAAGATPFSEACGVAVDPSGTVYVGDYSSGIHKFVPAANPPLNADNTATFTTVTNPCTLAAGAGATAGFLFAAQFNAPISKLDSATGEVKYVVSSGSYRTVTVDPGSGHVYAVSASDSATEEFDASGVGSASSVSSFTGPTQGFGQGVAVRSSTGEVYVSRLGTATKLDVFGPLVTLPDVTTEAASSIDETTATLNGAVNPDGVELSECLFEYGKSASYGQSVPCAQSPATIGSGTSSVAVSANISGLELGAEYHFRLVAKNTNGTVNGADQTFKLMSPPVIKEEWAASVVFSEASLRAKINPEGFATTYKFEWGTDTSYGEETAAKGIGSDKADHIVSAFLDGLQPGTTYHYRVTATNSIGTAVGPDRSFTTYELFPPDTCPNLAFRIGESAALADCRAYEMVSPVDKNGGDIRTFNTGTEFRASRYQAARGGGKVTYASNRTFGDAPSGHYSNQYVATRGPQGWSTHGIGAIQDTTIYDPEFAPFLELDTQFDIFTEDISTAWFRDFNKVPLTPDGIVGHANLYRQDTTTDSLEALTVNQPIGFAHRSLGEFDNCCESVEAQGISLDGSHVVVSARAALTPDAAAGTNPQLYDYQDGELHLASVLPDGTANPGRSQVGNGFERGIGGPRREAIRTHAVSDDGSRIFWTSNPTVEGFGKIYARIDGQITVPVSPELEESRFWAASREGSRALFETAVPLARPTLYVSDVDTEVKTLIAGDIYGVLGASDDLSHVYFLSGEVLDAGATAGERNLYLYEEGTFTFIATVSRVDNREPKLNEVSGYGIGDPSARRHASRITPDGSAVAFQSIMSLTGYDNTSGNGEPAIEVFVYDADRDELFCASCKPSGARPVTKPFRTPFAPFGVNGSAPETSGGEGERPAAGWLTTIEFANYASRPLSEDGNRVFFNSFDELLPADTNGVQDVYQWEAEGSGTCEKAGGCISLISTGQSPTDSEFIDASADGTDVFIETESSIDPRDPGLIDVYDARVGGGYPQPSSPTPCIGDACQSVPAPPNDVTPASASFKGAGDPAPRKARPRCRARGRKAAKGSKSQAKHKKAKRCKRAKRGAGR